MEVIKDIAAAVGLILSFISLITLCTKTGRAIVRNLIDKNTKELKEENQKQTENIVEIKNALGEIQFELVGLKENSKQQCRNTIKNIYYKYCEVKKIPLFERKAADYTYEIYSKYFNGNSYITLLYKEICKWEVITTANEKFMEE